MRTFAQDVRYAARSLRRTPGLWASGALVLALGVAGTTAIFSLIDNLVLRPADFDRSDRLVVIREQRPRTTGPAAVSPVEFMAWREDGGPVERMAALYGESVVMTGGTEPERVNSTRVSAEFFQVLGIKLEAGRPILPEDEARSVPVAVVARSLWERLFGTAALTGQTLKLDDTAVEVVGIAPSRFGFPDGAQVWRPMPLESTRAVRTHVLTVIGRLPPSVPAVTVEAHFDAINRHLATGTSGATEHRVKVEALHDVLVGDLRPSLLVLMGAVTFVLLLGCCSVASLLFARAARLQGEMSIKVALGATRGRLVKQLLIEGVVFAVPAVVLGLALAVGGLKFLIDSFRDALPRIGDVTLNATLVAFAVAASLVTGLLSSLLPALSSTSADVGQMLKDAGKSVVGHQRQVLRRLLVAGQFALATVLLIGAGLLFKSFETLRTVNPGFQADGVLVLTTNLPPSRYSGARSAQFYETLVQRLQALPGVRAVGGVVSLPLGGGRATRAFRVEGDASSLDGEPARAHMNIVTPGYFHAMQIPVVGGRDFTAGDARAAIPVAVVNRTLARRFFADTGAVGRQLRFDDGLGKETVTIVGVVGDVRQTRLQDGAEPEIYASRLRSSRLTMVIRSDQRADVASAAVTTVVRALDPDLPGQPKPMADVVASTIGLPQFRAALLGLFATVAVVIAIAGLAGLVSHRVTERVPELGLRLALGGRPDQVVRMIVREEVRWPLAGLIVGLGGALWLTRLLVSSLYSIQPTDPPILAGALGLLASATWIAAYFPARRAAAIDPAILIR